MSDVRIAQAPRLDGAQSGSLTRLGTEPTPAAAGARVLQAPSDTTTRGPQPGPGLTSRGAHEAISTPPSTPLSRLGTGTLDSHAAMRSFIDNLHALRFEATNDSDAMTSAFLKLEVTNMSTNQDMENLLNQAKHYIREAAFAVAKAHVAESLFAKAAALERGAAKLIKEAMAESGKSNDKASKALDKMEKGNSQNWKQTAAAGMKAGADGTNANAPDMQNNADTQQAVADMQKNTPANSSAWNKLSKAASMLQQAQQLRSQAYATLGGIAAAERAIAEGRSDDGQFGVQRRNMETQNSIMRGLTRLLSGSRPDRRAREDANREARDSQQNVVQLMREFVERDAASIARRGHPDRI